MEIFEKLRTMKTRTYFIISGPIVVGAFVVLFSYCLGVYGDICYQMPTI